jgi:hypothetical protein
MVVFAVLAVALIVALFVWEPWEDDDAGTGGGTVPGTEEGAGEGDVDIEGDIDVEGGDGGEGGEGGEAPEGQ